MESTFTGKVIKIGNSVGMIIPKNEIDVLGLKEGMFVKVQLSTIESEANGQI